MSVARVYGSALRHLAIGGIDMEGDVIKCALLKNTYIPDGDADEFFSDLTGEVSGTGYTAGGAVVANVTATWSAVDSALLLDCDNPAWVNATLSGANAVRIAVFYKSTGTAATSPLISYIDFESDQTVTGANVQIALPTSGFARINRL